MDFIFRNKELEKLYTTGKSKRLKLPSDIIEKFFARLQQDKPTIYNEWRNNTMSTKNWKNNELTIGDFIITDISNHYS